MNALLDAVGRWCARRHWEIIIAWVIILGVLLGLRSAFGGHFQQRLHRDRQPVGAGLSVLKKEFPAQGGYAGQIVFHAPTGSVAAQTTAVNTAMANVAKLPHVISAVSPFAVPNSPQVAKNGTTAYGTVSWDVVPPSLDTAYLNNSTTPWQPARDAGPAGRVRRRRRADRADDRRQDIGDHRPVVRAGAAAVHVRLAGRGGDAAAVGASSACWPGLSLVGLLAAAITFPTTAPTVATLLGLGVAVDYGLFLIARHREQLDHGMAVVQSAGRSTATSGAAIVVAGGTVVVAILGLYVSGVPFVGAMGLASAIVVAVTMLAALTLMPAFMGVAGQNVRAINDLRAAKRATARQSRRRRPRPRRLAALSGRQRRGPRTQRVRPVGPQGQQPALPWAIAAHRRCSSCWPSRCSRCGSGSSTPAPTRPPRASAAPTT